MLITPNSLSKIHDINAFICFLFAIRNYFKTASFSSKEPQLDLSEEVPLKCPYRTFATNGTDLFFWNGAKSRIDVYNYDDMTFKSSFAFGHHPEEVFDLLLIKNTLYIARFKPMKFIKVYQIDAGLVDDNTVLMFKLQYGGRALEISKSFSENILLTLIDRIMEISVKGEVIQAIDLSLPYGIRNALQNGGEVSKTSARTLTLNNFGTR